MKRLAVVVAVAFLVLAVALLAGCGVKWKRYSVVSVFNDSTLTGSVVLGTGFISDKEYYFVFARLPDGGLKRLKLLSSETVVYEDVVAGEPYVEMEYWNLLSNRLHVPKGTVTRHMVIDGRAEE